MRREQFYNKYGNNRVSSHELERKYRQHLYEQEMMELVKISKNNTSSVAGTISSAPQIEPFVDPDYVDDDYME